MQFFKLFLLTILFSFNIQAETWSFEKNDTEEGINYSSFVFSENYEDFFSIYCSDNDNEVYFLVNFKDENLFADQEDLINVYFDNDRTNEHVLVVDYDKGSAFFNKSSFLRIPCLRSTSLRAVICFVSSLIESLIAIKSLTS